MNPYDRRVWEYVVEVGQVAAKAGFDAGAEIRRQGEGQERRRKGEPAIADDAGDQRVRRDARREKHDGTEDLVGALHRESPERRRPLRDRPDYRKL